MKIEWNVIAIIASLLVVVIGWGVSVEIRMSQHASIQHVEDAVEALTGRVANLEKLLVPIIVDYRVKKELKELEEVKTKVTTAIEKPVEPPRRSPSQIRDDATTWTHQALEKGQKLLKK